MGKNVMGNMSNYFSITNKSKPIFDVATTLKAKYPCSRCMALSIWAKRFLLGISFKAQFTSVKKIFPHQSTKGLSLQLIFPLCYGVYCKINFTPAAWFT